MSKFKDATAALSLLTLMISLVFNFYMNHENNNLQLQMKYYETTFSQKQAFYSKLMIDVKDAYYSFSITNYPNRDQQLKYTDEIENVTYQLQPFFKNDSDYQKFREATSLYVYYLMNYDFKNRESALDEYFIHRNRIQSSAYNALFNDNLSTQRNEKMDISTTNLQIGISIATALFTGGALILTYRQIRNAYRVTKASFWIEIERLFEKSDNVHINLRPGGKWVDKSDFTASEFSEIEDYMGLFELCERMISEKVIDEETFKTMYKYRLINIVANKNIVKYKLVDEKSDWTEFINLLDRFNITY